jgi:phosphotransferase system IIB component
MDADNLKGQFIHNYLNQQLNAGQEEDSSRAVTNMELPDNVILEEFKNQVRLWMDIDNQIAKLQQAAKERKSVKKQLTDKILRFMGKYNIEDLNTKDGKLRYRVSNVKQAVSKSDIKQRLVENYGKVQNIEELTEIIFAAQPDKSKASLRRLRPGPN